MTDFVTFQISIPCDNDGYVLLQCEHCGTLFKITVADIEDNGILDLHCPACGLISEHFFTSEVIELAKAMSQNYATDLFYDAFKYLAQKTKHSPVHIEIGKKPAYERENPIKTGIEALEMASFKCCRRSAKIKPLLKITGCYCPFCGVKEYEVE